MSRTALALLAGAWLAMAGVGLPACGGADGGSRPELRVAAAASLGGAMQRYGAGFAPARVRFGFAGSDELAAQVRRGVRLDVYAAADTALPTALWRERLVERPVTFATNRLVIAVPARSNEVRSLADLERPGVDLVLGAQGVPIGSYTRQVLARLGRARRERILANVRSNEPSVSGVVAKVREGAADAGFVYHTDVVASAGDLRALELPAQLRPLVEYAAAVVRGSSVPEAARAFLAGLRNGAGAAALREAGFRPARP